MIKVTKEVIEVCAQNLLFDLNPGQADLIFEEFNTVLAQIDYLSHIPHVDEVDPMTFPYSEHQKLMREDRPSKPLKAQDAVKNCNSKLGVQVKLPKVVGHKNDQVDE